MIDYLGDPTKINLTDLDLSIKSGFLYPVRYRNIKKDILVTEPDSLDKFEIRSGSMVIYNLLNAELYFSSGPRVCVGQGLFRSEIVPKILELKKWITVCESESESENEGKSCMRSDRTVNIPVFREINNYEITLPPSYLEKIIPKYSSGNKVAIYDLISMYQHPDLFKYMVFKMIKQIQMIKSGGVMVDGIVAPEARALSLAGVIAYQLCLPLHTIRKPGKLPGDVHSVTYSKGYTDKTDTLELSKIDLIDKKLVLIDDGFASGGSAKACIDLINLCQGTILEVMVVVKHTYCEMIDLGVPVRHLFKIENY